MHIKEKWNNSTFCIAACFMRTGFLGAIERFPFFVFAAAFEAWRELPAFA